MQFIVQQHHSCSPIDWVGEVPVGGDEEEAAAGDVARQLASLQRLIAVLVAQLVAVGALVLVEHVGRELPALAADPHLGDRARAVPQSQPPQQPLLVIVHWLVVAVYRCATGEWAVYLLSAYRIICKQNTTYFRYT